MFPCLKLSDGFDGAQGAPELSPTSISITLWSPFSSPSPAPGNSPFPCPAPISREASQHLLPCPFSAPSCPHLPLHHSIICLLHPHWTLVSLREGLASYSTEYCPPPAHSHPETMNVTVFRNRFLVNVITLKCGH